MRIPLAFMVFVLAVACGGEAPKTDALVTQLGSQDIDAATGVPVAVVAAAKLGEQGDRTTVPALVEVLRSHPLGSARAAASLALGKLQSVDAIPTIIDAMLDMYGALGQADLALSRITGHDFKLPRPTSRGKIIAFQRTLRDWYRQNEEKLRALRGQPLPSRVPVAAAPPLHDSSATREQVVGPYLGHRWSYSVLIHLQDDGTFSFRGTSGQMNLGREQGTWQLTSRGIDLTWKFAPPESMEDYVKYGTGLAPRVGGPETTMATWSGGTLCVYPECRPPYDFRLRRLSGEELSHLAPELRAEESTDPRAK